jgi:UDP-glucose 4-epimerase
LSVRRAKGEVVIDMRGRRVLVVGGLGFIGSSLSDRLLALDANVTIVTPSRERHREAAVVYEARGARVLEGDLRDGTAMAHAVAGQDIIFNLAGQSGAVRSMEDPWTDLDVNCRGNLTLLEALRATNPGAMLVFVGSRLEYGKPEAMPVGEDHALDPLCLHAVHKLAVEQYLRVYRRLFGMRYSVARLTNPYGPGQPRARTAYGIVNRMIHLALSDETLTIYGDGLQKRDYIFIDDAVDALLAIGGSAAADGRTYNVGTGMGTRLVDMAQTVIRMAGGGRVQSIDWPPLAAQIETGDFIADISRLRQELAWRPQVTLDDGLRRTVAFYRAHVQC